MIDHHTFETQEKVFSEEIRDQIVVKGEKSLKCERFQELYHINSKFKNKPQLGSSKENMAKQYFVGFSYSFSFVELRICLPVNNSPNITGCS